MSAPSSNVCPVSRRPSRPPAALSKGPSTPGTRAFLRLAGRTPGSADSRTNVTGRRTGLQLGRLVAVTAAVAAVVSGCGSGPSQIGSAVIIGSTAVPQEQVQSRLDVALGKTDAVAQLARNGVGAPEIARDVVTRTVLHDLLTRTAATDGIAVSEADVDAALEQGGGADAALDQSLYDLSALRERVRDRIIAARHAERVLPGLSVTADLITAESRDDAAQKARVVAVAGKRGSAPTMTPCSRRTPTRRGAASPTGPPTAPRRRRRCCSVSTPAGPPTSSPTRRAVGSSCT